MSTTLLSPTAEILPPPISPARTMPLTVVLVGNPNAGKTSLFNSLTGMRQKVANYPGVTVERKEGAWSLASTADEASDELDPVRLIDLPGLYSIDAASPDERIARDVIVGDVAGVPAADVLLAVVDATNLRRNLYLVAQLLEFGKPVVVALTMVDTAEEQELAFDYERLAEALGVPVVPVVSAKRRGLDRLARVVASAARSGHDNISRAGLKLSPLAERELAKLINSDDDYGTQRFCALRDLYEQALPEEPARRKLIADARARLAVVNDDWWQEPVLARYRWIEETIARANTAAADATTIQDSSSTNERHTSARARNNATPSVTRRASNDNFALRLDRWTTHKIFGPAIFLLLMLIVFQTIFSWASLPMDLIDVSFSTLGAWVRATLAPGLLTDLIVDGVIAGVGGVLVFLPQIALLFFFVALLEDSGYMARAAFLMDRLMRGVGLHGKAFVPLLSSFACAIPGIMATRTIENPKDRLATIMIAPLMSCSARLPVYTLMIGAFFADSYIGFISTGAIVMMTMYALGVAAAICVAWILKRTLCARPRHRS
jgi:ferrous iron transport protein B